MTLGVTGKLVLAFVTLLLGAVLIGVIATNGLAVTDKKTVGNEAEAFTPYSGSINTTESHVVTNEQSLWKSVDCPLTSFAVKNGSGGTALTDTTDYTVALNNGTFFLKNTTTTVAMIGADNNTYLDYTYCGDDYLNSGWGRRVLLLVAGFFALTILLTSIALFFDIAKDTGIIDR